MPANALVPPDQIDPAAYDAWFRTKVQEALDDPRPDVSSEEVEAYFDQRKAHLLAAPENG